MSILYTPLIPISDYDVRLNFYSERLTFDLDGKVIQDLLRSGSR